MIGSSPPGPQALAAQPIPGQPIPAQPAAGRPDRLQAGTSRAPARAVGGGGFAALLPPQLAPPAANPGRAEAVPNPLFRQRIAEAERSAEHPGGGWHLRNPRTGALGRYQFLPVALQDIGWRHVDGRWTALAARHGVASEGDFLARPAAQEAAMTAFLQRLEVQLHRNGVAARRGAVLRGIGGEDIPLTEAGLLAAAHRRGAGMLARWLRHRTETPEAPLSAQQRAAFAQLERRLIAFAGIAYEPARAPGRPGPALARAAPALPGGG